MKRMNGMSTILVAIAFLISWYATSEWQGPHGIDGLSARLANIQALRARQACLEVTLAQKKARVDALQAGKYLDVEMHRHGFVLPGETKYVVPEPVGGPSGAGADSKSNTIVESPVEGSCIP